MSAVPTRAGAPGAAPGRSRAGVDLSGREALLLLIPALLPVVLLSVVPLVRGIYLGFTDSRAGLGVDTHFIGLDNFRRLIHDDLFVNSFKIGLIWAVSVTVIQFVLALGLALLLSQPLHGRWLARSLALVPWAMPLGDRRDHVEAHLPAAGRRPQRAAPSRPICPVDTSTGSPTSRGRCRR